MHLLVAVVEDRIVFAHEDITHDPERAIWGRDIESYECKQALALHLNDVVVGSERERLASKCNGQIWQAGDLGAIDNVLLSREACRTSSGGKLGHCLLWSSEERSTTVNDSLHRRSHNGRVTILKAIQTHLPVSLVGQRDGDEITCVVALVNTTKDKLSLCGCIIWQIECEDWLTDELL